MGRRRSFRYLRNLKAAAASSAADPAHEHRCRIVHAEQISAIAAASGRALTGACDQFILGHCRNPACAEWHPVRDYYSDGEGGSMFETPPAFAEHARRMNRILWIELWAMEHKLAFMVDQVAKISRPEEITSRERARRRREQRKDREAEIQGARERKIATQKIEG